MNHTSKFGNGEMDSAYQECDNLTFEGNRTLLGFSAPIKCKLDGQLTGIPLEFPSYIQMTATIFCAVILTLGTAGNILVPIVVCRTKELRNSTNFFLTNLSVADLLVLVVCMPTVLIELHSKPEVWLLGEIMCKVVPYVETTVAHGSILTILAISFERYYAICQPLKAGYTCTKMRALIIIVTVWLISIFVTSPILIIAEYKSVKYIDGTEVTVCLTSAHITWQKIYFFLMILILFWIPFAVLIAIYIIITRHLMTDRKHLNNATERCRMRSRKQVVLMLAAVVICFFVCLMPFRIFMTWVILVHQDSVNNLGMETYYNLLYFCRVMVYINSAINPILYNLISSKFRDAFVRVLCCHSDKRLIRQGTSSTTYTSLTTSLRAQGIVSQGSKSDSIKNSHLESYV